VTLGEIWMAAPRTPELKAGVGVAGARPLRLRLPPQSQVTDAAIADGRIELAVDGLSVELTDDELVAALDAYPSLTGGRPRGGFPIDERLREHCYVFDRPQVTFGNSTARLGIPLAAAWAAQCPVVSWPIEAADETAHQRAFERLALLSIAGRGTERMVLPSLGGTEEPHFLGLWWALLLCLSSVARYEPALWTATIDPDQSKLAVPLEQVCDFAIDFVPRILRDTLIQSD
jgi:hypothetical protein